MGINFSFNIRRKTTYKYNGVEYGSFSEMPEEARRIITANAPEAAKAAAEADEDRELEDLENPADQEIPADRRAHPVPPVKRLFVPARQPITGRRLAAAAPPPRRISRPLELAVLFGNPFVLLCWFISLLVFVPILDKLHGIVGGLREGLTAFSLPWLALPGAFIFSVAAAAFCGRWAFRWSRLQLDQLVNWPLCHGKLISKVMISDGDSEISRMKFEYEVGGRKYTNISDMNSASALEDEAEEPLLYDPAKPSRSMLVDELPASIILDESGGLSSRRPFMGYFYASLPLLLLAAMAAAAFR